MCQDPMDVTELERAYREKHFHVFKSLASRIALLMKDLLQVADIDVVQIEHRVKKPDSLVGKVKRKKYQDPFTEIKDFAGVRIIVYYNDDVERVARLIHSEFAVDATHSTDKLDELDVDEFGYRSFHIVSTLADSRTALGEWKEFEGRPFEIQIRSVLQHAWAAVSHKFDYKTAAQAPKELRRKLFRLSALLELADDEFASIRDKSKALVETYRREVDHGRFDLPLNLSSLTEFLDDRVDFEAWETLGVEAGMTEHMGEGPGQDVINTKKLFNTLHAMNVATIAEFDTLLRKHLPHAQGPLSELVNAAKELNSEIMAVPIDVLHFALALGEKKRLPKNFKFGDPWRDEIAEAINSLLSDHE